ncbi:hypothetical protein PybrP1_001211 [[Pythium] brassicae (nom. inval.)]|nr:hypothetical protein PybrP1_001211 [[Pythium] brassicae (nom. inval.)]
MQRPNASAASSPSEAAAAARRLHEDTPAELLEALHSQRSERDEKMATIVGRRAELRKLTKDESKWSFYRMTCQFRLGYFSFLVLMVILMFSFTFLMEIFFAIFLPSARMDPHFTIRAILLLGLLPFALILLSYLFEESSRLFLDAIDKREGSLSKFRLSLTVVIHYLRHRDEMPDDRLHQKLSTQYHGADADDAAWRQVVAAAASVPRRVYGFFNSGGDPFDDRGKEDEDRRREELELAFQQSQEVGLAASEPSSVDAHSVAAHRWKKAMMAANATVVFNKTRFDGPPLDFSTLVLVDILCPLLFEIVTFWTFVASLLASFSPVAAFLDYIQAGFYSLAAYLALWMVCHFWSSRNQKMREFVSNYRRQHREMKRALTEMENEKRAEQLWLVDIGYRGYEYFRSLFYTLFGYVYSFFSRCFAHSAGAGTGASSTAEQQPLRPLTATTYAEAAAAARADADETPEAIAGREKAEDLADEVRDWNPWNRFSYTRRFWILCPIVFFSAIISFSAFYLGWTIMGVSLVLLGYTIQGRFPQVFGAAFRSFITSFVILSFVFFSSTWAVGTFVYGGDFKVYPPLTTNTTTATNVLGDVSAVWGKIAQYPVCALDLHGLDIVDFALIADSVYGYNTSVQYQSFKERFEGTALGDWKYVRRNDEVVDHQVWVELFFPTLNVTVVAVRGTATATDALEDLHFWFGVTIMQAANVFIPFLKQLPTTFVVEMLSLNFFSSVMPPPVYSALLEYVVRLKQRVGDNLVLTGHSLGGAMAGMVGAVTKTPAVSFSGPGLLYTRGRFGISDEDIRDYVLTVKPRGDIVPKIDELGGMIQEIECRRTNPLACHSTSTHLCELYASCGDRRHRDWSAASQCTTYMAKK